MKTRLLAVLAVAGAAAVANAQDTTMTYTIVWDNAQINNGGTNTGAVFATITPGIGSTVKWTTSPGKGQNGTIQSFASSVFGAQNLLNGLNGTLKWTVPAALNLAGIPGALNAAGDLVGTNAGQVGKTLNPNPIIDNPIKILDISWTDTTGGNFLVNYGATSASGKMFLDIGLANGNWVGHNATKLAFGQGGFAVVPAPASMALLGLGGLVAARRRR
jgi:PEP-CTERM motif